MSESTTPRTDAELVLSASTGIMMVPADVARTLERELDEARRVLEELMRIKDDPRPYSTSSRDWTAAWQSARTLLAQPEKGPTK